MKLRTDVARSGVGWYPAVALGVLAAIDQLQGYAVLVLGPEIARSLGLPRATLAAILAVGAVVFTVVSLPIAALVQRRARRALVAVTTGLGWSLSTLGTGFVANGWGLGAAVVADGATSASVQVIHPPLLADSYPPAMRVRMLAFHRAIDGVGGIAGPVLVGVLAAAGLSWRGVFLALGVLSVVIVSFSVRLRDPGFGTFERADPGGVEEVTLRFGETSRRLWLVPTVRRILVGSAVVGVLLVPLNVYVLFFLDERWDVGPGGRGVFLGAMAAVAAGAMAVAGPVGERRFAREPASLLRLAAWLLVGGLAALAASILAPSFWLMAGCFAVSAALFAAFVPYLTACLLALVPARLRAHATALRGVFRSAIGGFGGLLLLSGFDRRFGSGGALLAITIPGVVAAVVLHRASASMADDLDRVAAGLAEEADVARRRRSGVRPPLLACRGLEVELGSTPVLRAVDLVVEEGELLAVVGTNGAGKSTLLATVAGTVLPVGGSVRFAGQDITHFAPERRAALGLTHIRAGDAVFPRLTVIEHLRVFAYRAGRDRAAVESGIDAAFGAVPVLAGRRDHMAATLSGGEQQLLGLARAIVVPARLLCVDELTVGLAPTAAADVLAVLRGLNAGGTTVIVVEQSLDVAVDLSPRAIFLERGEVRYDGPAAGLRQRPDLVRAVFLGRNDRSEPSNAELT